MQTGQARVVLRGDQLQGTQCVAQQRLEAAAQRRQLLAVVGVRELDPERSALDADLASDVDDGRDAVALRPNGCGPVPMRDLAREDRRTLRQRRSASARDSRASPTAASRAPATKTGLAPWAKPDLRDAPKVARAFRLEAGAAKRDDRVSARRHRQCYGNATGRQRVPPGAWRQAFSGSVARRFMSSAGTGLCLAGAVAMAAASRASAPAFACSLRRAMRYRLVGIAGVGLFALRARAALRPSSR